MKPALALLYEPWRSALRVWDRVSIYLPIVLMGALALSTYWLVRNSPVFAPPEAAKAARHDVDYFMRKFTIKSFDEAGALRSEIKGLEGLHYADTDTLEIDQPRILSISDAGRRVTSTSRRGLSNGDGSEVQLFGDARVVREPVVGVDGELIPRMEFSGEFLHAFVNEERVKSHLPVVLTRGPDQFSGDTFAYNNVTGIVELKGRVKGLMVPKASVAKP
ncbi:MAG: LPS export ABC transporter periplasmic protein LptC [Polaromonas sp.]|jgi:lipopolysaccharide export system protein LptC